MPYFPGMALSCCYEVFMKCYYPCRVLVLSCLSWATTFEVSSQHLNCVYVHC
uniref:Uncharacterized protein n=1 Tax=Arundo donax TaxID=35708 RepID=A0A0A9DM90_ARUDO